MRAQILRCAQDDNTLGCHPERSEGSTVDLWVITGLFSLNICNVYVTVFI